MIDKEHIAKGYANSNGYFKNPVTGEWLSGLEERATKAAIEGTKFIWPTVLCGNSEYRIVYKIFSQEEKELYKKYRAINKNKFREQKTNGNICTGENETSNNFSNSDSESEDIVVAESATAKAYIAICDQLIGVCNIGGLSYAIITADKGRHNYYVPNQLITTEQRRRLCGGTVSEEDV